jgi:hypothetical protein
MKWKGELGLRFRSLREIYGDSYGGVLVKNLLKAAILAPRQLFAVYNIHELRELPAVQRALLMDPAIDFFMHAANVWYYGLKGGELYVFDSEFDELDSMGPVEAALEEVMDRWE